MEILGWNVNCSISEKKHKKHAVIDHRMACGIPRSVLPKQSAEEFRKSRFVVAFLSVFNELDDKNRFLSQISCISTS